MDYQYVNDPNNMGGLRVVDNKIVDPRGILSGKNFEMLIELGEMYDKEISILGGLITDLKGGKKGGLNKKDAARLNRLKQKQIKAIRLELFIFRTNNTRH